MPILGVNIDHVATLRQCRDNPYPDPVAAALACQDAGAHSIVAHLREDRRHIQDTDVRKLRERLSIRFNLEMSVHPSVMRVALDVCPDVVTLVPERRQERTTESGLSAAGMEVELKELIPQFRDRGIDVSLFIEARAAEVKAASRLGVQAVEFHTGPYAHTSIGPDREAEVGRIRECAKLAASFGLKPHVGHGLDYDNVSALAKVPALNEFNIGFSIVSRALFMGMDRAVRDMLDLLQKPK